MDREKIVAAVISASGGEVAGRVRLQKVFYLLDQLGLDSGFRYEYYHYGPYSAELTAATEDAKEFDYIEETTGFRRSDGARFSIFKAKTKKASENACGKLDEERVRQLIGLMKRRSATVLELAATVDWLRRFEKIENWKPEIKRRKGVKIEGGRLDQALELLDELGLRA